MKINRDEIFKAIQIARPATANIEDMSNLYYSGEDIVAYNDKMCIHAPFKSDFSFLLNGNLMFNFIEKVDAAEVHMSLQGKKGEEKKLIMKAEGIKATLTTVLGSEIIERSKKVKEELTSFTAYELPPDFTEGAHLCMFSASNDPAMGTMTCLKVEGNELKTGDKRRGSIYTMKEEMESFMIEAKVASELKKLEDTEQEKITMYGVTDSWVHFGTESGVYLSVRKILGEFPDYSGAMDRIKGTKIKLPAGIKNAIETSSLIVEGQGVSTIHSVRIELSKNVLRCVGKSDIRGTIEKESKVSYEGDDIYFSISPTFLLEILNTATTVIIKEEKDLALFRSGSFRHVMTLPIISKDE